MTFHTVHGKQFAPWKKSYDRLSLLKSRDIILPTKFRLVKAVVFPVVVYGVRDAFELWCQRRLLRVP